MEVLKNIKIIFIDIDKTLMTDKKRITLKTRKSIKRLVDKGIYVVLTSGRDCKYCIDKSRRALASPIVISSNGAEIYDYINHKLLSSDYIENEKLEKIWDYCEKNEIGLLMNTIKGRYLNKYLISDNVYKNYRLITTSRELKKLNVSQCIFIDNNFLKFMKSEKFIKQIGLDIAYFSKSFDYTIVNQNSSMDVINKNISKGSAITKLLKILNIEKENSLCFGDYLNDLEMFEACGYKIAMENACDELKEKADYITLSNNKNGISYFLDNYIE